MFLSEAITCQNLVCPFIYFIVFLLLFLAAINHRSNCPVHVAQQNSEIYVGEEHILRKRKMAKIASKVIHVKGFPGPQFRFNPEDCCGQEYITASDQNTHCISF